MTDRAALLDHADQLLDGKVDLGMRGARTAALLARCALEDWLDDHSASWPKVPGKRPTTRSKLVALGAQRDADTRERAKRAWHDLSRACHHHAYELQPSVSEVRLLVAQVRQLSR
ncbi:hypothetical protein [Mycolicibacterium sp. XJ870]